MLFPGLGLGLGLGAWHRLERAGQPIGGNDLLIAAQALTLGQTIVTDNEREFARIDGLAFENWLRAA